jgi:hypothetical protein
VSSLAPNVEVDDSPRDLIAVNLLTTGGRGQGTGFRGEIAATHAGGVLPSAIGQFAGADLSAQVIGGVPRKLGSLRQR